MLSGAEKTNENTRATFKPESTLGIRHHYLSVLLTSESSDKVGASERGGAPLPPPLCMQNLGPAL